MVWAILPVTCASSYATWSSTPAKGRDPELSAPIQMRGYEGQLCPRPPLCHPRAFIDYEDTATIFKK
ncbi:hypothetical protein RSOLAG1IB_03316 [Rhizoctonia solani AG-1 IB]|uniref:Uncharacterized protein n=1 Tax=Thanatephorus cucumeris (strain AG1-IB / isolate 7/3/14) TaxID=1108050 RepID=A0A0B7FT21_THACB|nr:hypothetical protein RSOLAG1IB_03316 [Rhizoctonia solani AG-1 IB]